LWKRGFVASKLLEKLEEKEALQIFAQIVQGVACLHQKDIAHRDLSLENVLCCDKGTWKITDFGLCSTTLHYHQETVGKP
jgi:serine/threonine protein kinase